MPVRFLTPNPADTATIIESTEAAGFVAENVQDVRLTKRWRTKSAGITTLDDCEATTGWTGTNAPAPTLDAVNFTEGSNSLNLGKLGGASTGDYAKTLASTFDLTNALGGLDFYVTDKTDFTSIRFRIGNNGTDYFFKDFASALFTDAAFNDILALSGEPVQDWSTAGSPDITTIDDIRIEISTSPSTATIALGRLKMDFWRFEILDEFLEFDFTTAQAATAAVIDGHDFDGTETNILLDSSADAITWTNRATFTFASGEAMVVFIDSVSARYWRIIFTKAASTEFKEIGRVFIGTYIQPTRGIQLGGRRTLTDTSQTKRAFSGTQFADLRNKFWELDFKIKHEPQATFDALRDALSDLGIGTALWLAFEPIANPNGPFTLYGRFSRPWSETEPLNGVFDLSVKFGQDL